MSTGSWDRHWRMRARAEPRYSLCMSEQIAVRIPDALVHDLDQVVAHGDFASRAEAVRTAIVALVDAERRRHIGVAIAEGYRRRPQTDDEVERATAAAIASIHEEPW